MNLYITSNPVPSLQGVVVTTEQIGLPLAHLSIASRAWDKIFVSVDECIPEGSLRFLPTKCKEIRVQCPAHPSIHQLHLLVELYPQLDGKLRKAYMKGDDIRELLPEMW